MCVWTWGSTHANKTRRLLLIGAAILLRIIIFHVCFLLVATKTRTRRLSADSQPCISACLRFFFVTPSISPCLIHGNYLLECAAVRRTDYSISCKRCPRLTEGTVLCWIACILVSTSVLGFQSMQAGTCTTWFLPTSVYLVRRRPHLSFPPSLTRCGAFPTRGVVQVQTQI